MLLNDKKFKDAEEYYRKALAIQDKLVADFSDQPSYREDLARSHFKLGRLLKETGKAGDAMDHCYKGIALLEKLVLDLPGKQENELALGRVYELLATIKLEMEKPGESIPWFDKAIETIVPVREANP